MTHNIIKKTTAIHLKNCPFEMSRADGVVVLRFRCARTNRLVYFVYHAACTDSNYFMTIQEFDTLDGRSFSTLDRALSYADSFAKESGCEYFGGVCDVAIDGEENTAEFFVCWVTSQYYEEASVYSEEDDVEVVVHAEVMPPVADPVVTRAELALQLLAAGLTPEQVMIILRPP